MRLLTRYLTREILAYAAGVFVLILGVFLVRRSALLLAELTEAALPIGVVLELLALRTMMAFPSLLPSVVYIAVLLALTRLNENRELEALQASGVSRLRIYRSVVPVAVAGALAIGLLALWGRPWAAKLYLETKAEATVAAGTDQMRPGRFYELDWGGGHVFFAERRATDDPRFLEGVFLQQVADGQRWIHYAERALEQRDDAGNRRLLGLFDGRRYAFPLDVDDQEIIEYAELVMAFPLPETEITVAEEEMPVAALLAVVARPMARPSCSGVWRCRCRRWCWCCSRCLSARARRRGCGRAPVRRAASSTSSTARCSARASAGSSPAHWHRCRACSSSTGCFSSSPWACCCARACAPTAPGRPCSLRAPGIASSGRRRWEAKGEHSRPLRRARDPGQPRAGARRLRAHFSVIALMEELRSIGRGSYTLGDAAWFVFLRLPAESFELFPGAALVGCVLGLSQLAGRGELIGMHACGVSYLRLAASALQAAAVAGVAMTIFAEVVAAPLARTAHVQRTAAVSGGRAMTSSTGLWTRWNSSVVNVRNVSADGTLRDVFVYEFDPDNRLRRYVYAQSGRHTGEGGVLEGVVESSITEDAIRQRRVASETWNGLPQPANVQSMLLPAEDISVGELRSTIANLRQQRLLTHRYELAFWRRVTTPVIALVMMLIAMPLVLSSIAQRRQGRAIVIAALAGVGFQMLNQTFATFALVYRLPPFLGATAPGLAALFVGVWRFRRLH
jgi:lipopolysaccharide export system permease protein